MPMRLLTRTVLRFNNISFPNYQNQMLSIIFIFHFKSKIFDYLYSLHQHFPYCKDILLFKNLVEETTFLILNY